MSDHARLSPSARHRWGACPASVRESEKYAHLPRGENIAAIDGTHTHTLLANCLSNDVSNALTLVSIVLADDDGEFTVDAERAARVNVALTYVQSRLKEMGGRENGVRVLAEQRVNPMAILDRNDMSGTVDVQIIADGFVEIIDYKDGMGEVQAFENPQLEQYAWGVIAESEITIDRVRMTIIQPKLVIFGKPAITHYEVTLVTFMEGLEKIKSQAVATDSSDSPHVSGEHCKYCPHANKCSERTSGMLSRAGIKFGSTTIVEQLAKKSATDLTPIQIREIVESLPMLRGWLDTVETAALERLKAGEVIDGLKVVRGRGVRSWAFPDSEVETKLRKMGVPKSVVWKTSLISPAAAEKLKWQIGEKQKQLSPKQLEILGSEMILNGEGRLNVVSAADDRKAVDFQNVGAMFGPTNGHLPSWLT